MFKDLAIWGRFAPLGLVIIVVSLGIDQFHKWWMLFVYEIAKIKPVAITSFFDLTLVWNTGVSYGLLNNLAPWVLVAGQLAVCIFLWFWLAGAKDRLTAIAIGLVIGGALGNVADRLIYRAVADFFHFHAFGYSWYVFNLADIAIVAGAAILVYGSLREMMQKDG